MRVYTVKFENIRIYSTARKAIESLEGGIAELYPERWHKALRSEHFNDASKIKPVEINIEQLFNNCNLATVYENSIKGMIAYLNKYGHFDVQLGGFDKYEIEVHEVI